MVNWPRCSNSFWGPLHVCSHINKILEMQINGDGLQRKFYVCTSFVCVPKPLIYWMCGIIKPPSHFQSNSNRISTSSSTWSSDFHCVLHSFSIDCSLLCHFSFEWCVRAEGCNEFSVHNAQKRGVHLKGEECYCTWNYGKAKEVEVVASKSIIILSIQWTL